MHYFFCDVELIDVCPVGIYVWDNNNFFSKSLIRCFWLVKKIILILHVKRSESGP